MIWVPLLGFDPYCGGKYCYPYEMNLPQVSTQKQFFLQNLWANFEKSRNPIFLKTLSTDLDG